MKRSLQFKELMDKHPTLFREIGKVLGLLALLAVMMLWLSGAFRSKVEPGPPVAQPPPPSVHAQPVETQVFPLTVEQVGTVRTRADAQISSRIMAQVIEIEAHEGMNVQGPDANGANATILARLDDRDAQARIRQAKSQVSAAGKAMDAANANMKASQSQAEAARAKARSAAADLKRYQDLFRSQAATGQQLDHARAQSEAAEAQLQAALQAVSAAQSDIERAKAQKEQSEAALSEAHVALSYTVVRAPFSGRIVGKTINVGDTIGPGQPMFSIETSSQPELHAVVSESLLPYLHTGQDVQVHIDTPDELLKGRVREITAQADPSTRTVMVKVSLPQKPELVAGSFGRLLVPTGEYNALVIPAKAAREVGQLQLVDVLDASGHPVRRFVTLGQRHGDLVEVLSGLKEKEEVVLP